MEKEVILDSGKSLATRKILNDKLKHDIFAGRGQSIV